LSKAYFTNLCLCGSPAITSIAQNNVLHYVKNTTDRPIYLKKDAVIGIFCAINKNANNTEKPLAIDRKRAAHKHDFFKRQYVRKLKPIFTHLLTSQSSETKRHIYIMSYNN
jgi:hypothetical protein